MKHTLLSAALVGSFIVLSGITGFAGDQVKPMKRFLLKDPNGPVPDPDPSNKKMKLIVKEGPESTNTVVGDPKIDGAVLFVKTTPGISQCFELPKEGWSNISTLGFKYKNPKDPSVVPAQDVRGGIKVAKIKKTPSGVFQIKVIASAKTGPIIISTHPSNDIRGYLLIRGGDRYCVHGVDPNATVTETRIKNAPAPSECADQLADTFCSPSGAFLD
jgi:hypothetical protein